MPGLYHGKSVLLFFQEVLDNSNRLLLQLFIYKKHFSSVLLLLLAKIGGTFSSRVSEQCLSACRCTIARLTVPEL